MKQLPKNILVVGIIRYFDKYNLSLYLLYNKESKEKLRAAQHIKKSLEPYGIKVQLQSVDFEEYKKRIETELEDYKGLLD